MNPARLLLDTCVLSELVRPIPDPAVVAWFDRFAATSLLCAPVVMELQAGLGGGKGAPASPKLAAALERLLRRFPVDRRCVFDEPAALEAATALREARRSGRPLGVVDAQIIGLAAALSCAVVTRDADFEDRGVSLVNPWKDG